MSVATASLQWTDGAGFLDPGPHPESVYDRAYWDKYVGYAGTDMGRLLNAARVELVDRYCAGERVCDVGIGCGAFIEARGGETYGHDINPIAIEWLHERGLWMEPRESSIRALTFWDSLEHITDPGPVLGNVAGYVFVSAPIFRDATHVLRSKHYRPGEHCHYWTHDGLIHFMEFYGFGLVEHNTMETDLGREDIGTYVFQRRRRPYLMSRWAGQPMYVCPWCKYSTTAGEDKMMGHMRSGHTARGVRLIEGVRR